MLSETSDTAPGLYVPETVIYTPSGDVADLRTDDEKRLAASTTSRQRRRRATAEIIDQKLKSTGVNRKFRRKMIKQFTREFQGRVTV